MAEATHEAQLARAAAQASAAEQQRVSSELSTRAAAATHGVLQLQEEVRSSIDERQQLMSQLKDSRSVIEGMRSEHMAAAAAAAAATCAWAVGRATAGAPASLLLELAGVHILAARMSDYETPLSGLQVAVSGTLTAFSSTLCTVIFKLVFRWGNIHRHRIRKGANRAEAFCRWLIRELQGKETLFHGLQSMWYDYRTKGVRRAPKKAIKKSFVVMRGYFAWFLNFTALAASVVLCLLYGVQDELVKFESTLCGWAVAVGESFLLVEPIVIAIIFAFPRAIDRIMLPQDVLETVKKQRKGPLHKRSLRSLKPTGAAAHSAKTGPST